MKYRTLRRTVIGFLALILLAAACAEEPVPPQLSDGWQIAAPSEVGIDVGPLEEAASRMADGTYPNMHGILIVREGKLVFEEYFDGFAWDFEGEDFRGEPVSFTSTTPHNQASVTKSFTATLIGIAIDEGFIESKDQRVFGYFPEYSHLSGEGKEEITLQHLLTMSAGLEWNGLEIPINSRDPTNDVLMLFSVDDPIGYILAKPLVSTPGTEWYYSGGATVLLGEILHRASGLRADEFAERYLFEPLGIADAEWFFIQPDLVFTAGNLRVTPRDMAKLGLLYLNGGVWDGTHIVSEDWIDDAVKSHSESWWSEGYGYQWWVDTLEFKSGTYSTYFASGWGGQRIMVFPELDLVVVLTAGNYTQVDPALEILENHILPAVVSE